MELKFDNLYRSVIFGLRFSGSHPDIPKNPRWIVKFSSIFVISAICTVWLLNSIFSYDIKEENLVNAYRNSTIFVMGSVVNIKYGMLLYYRKTFSKILNAIDSDYDRSNEWAEDEKEIVVNYTKKTYTVAKIWCLLAAVTSSLFPLKSFVLMFYHYLNGEFRQVPMFDLHYPAFLEPHKDELVIFIALYALHMLFAIYCASIFMGFEPLCPMFVLHPCGLLQVIIVRLLKLFEAPPENVKANLKECAKMLQHIYEFVDDLNKVYTVMNEINVKFTPIMIALIAFQLVESVKEAEPNLEFMSLLIGVFVYFLFPCYYSDHLQELGQSVREAMYSCQWENYKDLSARSTIIILMTRAVRPPSICSYFCTLCLDTFAEMCRQAYTIFNVMNVAYN